jgi:hypothetical protein
MPQLPLEGGHLHARTHSTPARTGPGLLLASEEGLLNQVR